MIANHWIWIYIGAGLMLLELVVPGFILCFFGLAAATVGVLSFLFGDGFNLTWQLASFSALSVIYIVLLRRWFRRALTGDRHDTGDLGGDYLGRTGKVVTAIRPPLAGRVLIGDSEWTAVAESELAEGSVVKVIFQHNLTMKVEAVK